MPTTLDRALQSRSLFLGFAGLITAVSVWVIWGPTDMFPPPTPVGPPEMWIDDDLKQFLIKAGSPPKKHISREELVQKVRAIIDNQKTVAT